MARPSPSCAHDDDRLRLPAASPSRSNSAEKKESTDPRLSQLCPPYVTPSSSSSLEYHRSDARIVENGFAAGSGMSNSAKVGLGGVAQIGLRIVTRHQLVYRFGPLLPWSREIAVAVHHEPRPSVELLVLQVASREIGAQQIPGELEQLHALPR